MSNERFIKFIDSEESQFLQENYPNAFLLLCTIARRARRLSGHPDGLEIGECHLGDYKNSGIETRDKYRHALEILTIRKHIEKIETCRTRQKTPTGTPTGTPTIGTKVSLLRSDIWDINPEVYNHLNPHRNNHRTPTEPPRTRKNKINKKEEEKINEKEKIPERAPQVFISDEDHQKLVNKYSAEFTQACYLELYDWKINNPEKVGKRSDIGRIKKWVVNAVRENNIKSAELDAREKRLKTFSGDIESVSLNEQFAKQIEKTHKAPYCRLEINCSGVEFTPLAGADQNVTMIKFNEKDFKDRMNSMLRQKQFVPV